jgi:hypothetical protein
VDIWQCDALDLSDTAVGADDSFQLPGGRPAAERRVLRKRLTAAPLSGPG